MRQSKSVPQRKSLTLYLSTTATSTETEDQLSLNNVPEGVGLHDYRVHFAYVERSTEKEELVKLRLCLRCAPSLYYGKGGGDGEGKEGTRVCGGDKR